MQAVLSIEPMEPIPKPGNPFHERSVLFSRNHDDDRRCIHARAANLAGQFQTIGRRHAHIQKDRVKFLFGQALGGFGTARQRANFKTCRPQDLGDQFARRRMIVYDKDLGKQAIIPPRIPRSES